MKTCRSCKENKNDNEFPSYKQSVGSKSTHVKKNICQKCLNNSEEGVNSELVHNNIKIKNKTFKEQIPDGYKVGGFKSFYKASDCAIDEAELDYSDFEDIPDITEIIKKEK